MSVSPDEFADRLLIYRIEYEIGAWDAILGKPPPRDPAEFGCEDAIRGYAEGRAWAIGLSQAADGR